MDKLEIRIFQATADFFEGEELKIMNGCTMIFVGVSNGHALLKFNHDPQPSVKVELNTFIRFFSEI